MAFGEFLKKTADKREMYKKLMIISAVLFTACTVGLVYVGYDLRHSYVVCDNLFYFQTFISTIWSLPLILLAISACFFLFGPLENTKFGRLVSFSGTNLNTIFIVQWILVSAAKSTVDATEAKLDLHPSVIVLLGFIFVAAAIGITGGIKAISLRRKGYQ